jgi:murein DD-endopeptidase MepM/ murein hydrolase activator NlpD
MMKKRFIAKHSSMRFGLILMMAAMSAVIFCAAVVFNETTLATKNADSANKLALKGDSVPVPSGATVKRPSAALQQFAKYFSTTPENLYEQKVTVRAGDTLIALLQAQNVDVEDAHVVVKALKDVWDPKNLKLGQELYLIKSSLPDTEAEEADAVEGIYFRPDPETDVLVYREDESFTAEKLGRTLQKTVAYGGSVIDSSLFEAGDDAGVPMGVMIKMIRAFSYDVDFQRDLKNGDKFEIVFEKYVDDKGEAARTGNILYASLLLSGKERRIYSYENQEGEQAFYDRFGMSIKKALLKTPVDNVRMSSGFGMRFHPILGYSKMHKGVDFAASIGTPIHAAGNGIIAEAGPNGAYGNYVKIRHNSEFATAYAHMSAFRKGIKEGMRVKQGDVIGYVGTTGRSTGPHLHYEVLVKGEQANPSSLKLPTAEQLTGKELVAFKNRLSQIDMKLIAMRRPANAQVAQRAVEQRAN